MNQLPILLEIIVSKIPMPVVSLNPKQPTPPLIQLTNSDYTDNDSNKLLQVASSSFKAQDTSFLTNQYGHWIMLLKISKMIQG